MAKNDPDKLMAEAQEMFAQMTNSTPEPEASDTQVEEEELQEEAPAEPVDTAESTSETVEETDSASGDESESMSALEKAEKAMKGAQARMTKATQEAAELRKQIADQDAVIKSLQAKFEEKQANPEKLDKLREEFPDIANPLLDELERTQNQVKQANSELQEQRKAKEQAEIQSLQDQHFQRIRDHHPDVDTIANSADWINWLEAQDKETQQWVDSGSSNDVNAVLHRFKVETGIKSKSPQEVTLERAKKVAEPKLPKARKSNLKGNQKSWSVDSIKNMSHDDFLKQSREILNSMAAGQIRR